MHNLQSLVLLSVGAFIFAGCGDAKEQAAIARIQNRRDPGFIRLVNLTGHPSKMKVNGKDYGQSVPPSKTTVFLATPNGATKIDVEGLAAPIDYDMKPKTVISVYLIERDGKVAAELVEGEPRNLPKGSIQVSFLTIDAAQKYEARPSGEPAMSVPVFQPSAAIDVALGEFKADFSSNGGSKFGVSFKAIDQGAYTVVIRQVDGKPQAIVLNNHPDRGLSMAGATGA